MRYLLHIYLVVYRKDTPEDLLLLEHIGKQNRHYTLINNEAYALILYTISNAIA